MMIYGGKNETKHTQADRDKIEKEAQTIITEAEKYAANYKSGQASIEGTSGEQPNMGKEVYEYNGETYIKVGPINWTYTGTYSKAQLFDQNNKVVTVKYARYEGSTLKVYDKIADASKSGQDFYILINTKDNVTKINKFEATVTKKVTSLKTIVWVLTNGYKSNSSGSNLGSYAKGAQNVIYTQTDETSQTTEDTISIEEIPLLGDLQINKTDETTNAPLANVGFTLKATSGEKQGQYVTIDANGNASYTQEESTIITDEKGQITIKSLYPGTYELIEVLNPNPGYSNEEIIISSNIEVTPGNTNEVNVTNKRAYINIWGYVWEDKSWDEGKQTFTNYLYQEEAGDINDKRVANVIVQLKDRDGNVIQEKTTDEEGNYEFEDVLIEQLKNYYIEFLYNGICYESVPVVDLSKENGTKATESSNREEFNQEYARIAKGDETDPNIGESQNANGEEVHKLQYDTSTPYTSKILYGEENNYKYGYEGQKYPVAGIDEQYLISSNTRNAYLDNNPNGEYTGYLTDIKSEEEIINESLSEIGNINLGILERAMPDITLKKDLESARVAINGEEHIYKYADRFDNIAEYGDGYTMDPKLKFEEKYASMTYTRALYASDINYIDNEDSSKELSVKATYKIGITNISSGSLTATINEVVDFYDSKYTLVSAGTEINEDGSIKEETKIQDVIEENITSVDGEYNKIRIRPNLIIESQKEVFIYVEVEVKKDKIVEILGDANTEDEEYVQLDNIAEVSSYSISNENGVYAGIDIDSQPGNSVPGETSTYEDDADRAPGFKLVLAEERKVDGLVFEDNAEFDTPENGQNENLHTEEVRQGNGQYDEGENKIPNVDVKIIDPEDGTTVEVWDDETKTWVPAETKTNTDGEYTIGGLVPGDYQIIYTWGDNQYRVQDYKSTIVDEEEWTSKNSNDKKYKENIDIINSDAVDNLDQREIIDNENQEETNAKKELIDKAYNGEPGTGVTTKIDSSTPTFKVDIEYDDEATQENTIKNVDFGIIRRPKQVLELNKRISSAKVTLANGNTLIEAQVSEDGTLTSNTNYVQYMKPSPGAAGQLKIEVDNELVQGSTLEVRYTFKINNISELDYTNDNFYLYGQGSGETQDELVALTPARVIDYLDNTLSTDVARDGSVAWNTLSEAQKQELVTNGLLNSQVEVVLDSTEKVITTESLATPLKPGESVANTDLDLEGTKLLSNNDETVLENNSEIIRVVKTGGSSLITIPGNYVPTDTTTYEYDDSTSERLIILPPTGLTVDYIAYTILAISSLGVLVTGIILIKKFVLKK